MRNLLIVVLGLFTGAFASSLASGCGSCPEQTLLAPGAYVPSDSKAAESDYTLTLSTDRKTVTETYTRKGTTYTTVYGATAQP
ncbi:MAG: hypothetical protein EXR79_17130 [Myxococcales bacterium]|nr:hypothetical protein [Myxococcales bacterium]